MKSTTKIKSEPTISYLIFSIGEDRFAIEAFNVRRIVNWSKPMPMPGVKKTDLTIVDVDNDTSVVFMLEDLLPQKPSEFKYLILANHPTANVAISATNVYELVTVPESAIKDTPKVIENPEYYKLFSKSYIDDKGIVIVFDVGQLKL